MTEARDGATRRPDGIELVRVFVDAFEKVGPTDANWILAKRALTFDPALRAGVEAVRLAVVESGPSEVSGTADAVSMPSGKSGGLDDGFLPELEPLVMPEGTPALVELADGSRQLLVSTGAAWVLGQAGGDGIVRPAFAPTGTVATFMDGGH